MLLRRVEQLEGEVSRKNAQPQEFSVLSPDSIGTSNRVFGQGESSPCISGYESLSYTLSPPVPQPTVSPTPMTPNHESRSQFFLSRHLGQNWYFKGIPILSPAGQKWITSRTDKEAPLANFLPFFSTPVRLSSPAARESQHNLQQDLYELPSEHETFQILGIYSQETSQHGCPVLDPLLFKATLQTAYGSSRTSDSILAPLSAMACVWALHAMMSRSKAARSLSFPLDSEKWAGRVQAALGYLIQTSSLESLQAILMLVSKIPSHTRLLFRQLKRTKILPSSSTYTEHQIISTKILIISIPSPVA